jgi:hypothetical protein
VSHATAFRLAAIIVAGICLRLPNFLSPYLLDDHSFRQGDTAGFALGYLTESFNPFHPTVARQPCASPEPFGRVEAELPLYAWITVVPLKLLGFDFPTPTYLRLWWLGYFAAGCVYLALLARRLGASRPITELCVGTYAALPLSVFFTISIQPDGPALTFAFAAIYHLAALLGDSTPEAVFGWGAPRKHEIAFVVSAALLLLTKLSNAYVGLPLLFLLVHYAGWRAVLYPRPLVWLALTLSCTVGWYYYSKQVSLWSFGIWGDSSSKWSGWDSVLDSAAWTRFAHRAKDQILTWPVIVLMVTGFIVQSRHLLVRLGLAWALGFLALLCATVPVQKIHIYYQLPMVVPAAMAAPFAIELLWQRKFFGRVALGIAALFFVLASHRALAANQDGFFKEERGFIPGIELVRSHVPFGEMFVSDPSRPELYYNSRHRGYIGPRTLNGRNLLECMKRSKTRFLLLDRGAQQQLSDMGALGFAPVATQKHYTLYRKVAD